MSIKRVAVIFDNTARPETTGVYCRRALGKLVEVDHFLPNEVARIPKDYDLYLRIDDGFRYRLPPELRPCACWTIDTHIDFDAALAQAREYDVVFAAQKDGTARLREAGITAACWLPLACDPEMHQPQEVATELDWCFVGNVFPGPRQELIEFLQHRFPKSFVGQRYFREMCRTYSASRVVINRSIANDINMRVFEALACGSLLLTNDLSDNGQRELFEDWIHLATYRNPEELSQRLKLFLGNDSERKRIAEAGRAEVLAKHTYLHRMGVILQAVEDWQATQRKSAMPKPGRTVPPSAPQVPAKTSAYFEHARPEVLALVPPTATRVLDIGCGSGRLGESIRRRQSADVVGIELQPEAAAMARTRLNEVRTANVEDTATEFPDGHFDCVICADVFEHLRHPENVLKKVRRWLAPEGTLVVSLPNVQNHTVLAALAEGNWTYEPAGLLDEDHIRFFTRREIEKLLFRTGFQIAELQAVPGPGFQQWNDQGRPREVAFGKLRLSGLSTDEAEGLFVYQYLAVAKPMRERPFALTSIIIVTFNQLPYTRECVDSLLLRTDEPIELIFVDNGSMDGTPEYLQSIAGAKVILNPGNRGFPAAVNQGLKVATGEQVLLLNNDTVVTTGWLRRMLEALHRDPRTGLVGLCSNFVSGPQQVPVTYDDLGSLDGFAWDWARAHAAQEEATDRLVGFCLLIRRETLDRVGQLDERFGIGCFEDDDFCRRAMGAGYRCVIARDAFIHHYGSRSFAGARLDLRQLLEENQKKFEAKWAPAKPAARIEQAIRAEPAATRQSRISLCMIVRNNEGTISAALASARPWVDEMIVVDTGSTDRTMEICRQHGARVEHFAWIDDFSAARNESLKYATGDWIFWMDSDDTLPEECGRQLRALVDRGLDPHILGVIMQVHCPVTTGEASHDLTVVDHVKLFRNRSDLRFEFRIHEQIIPSIRRAGGDVARTDIYVVHSGSDQTPEGRQRKLERDYRILHLELKDHPDHPFVLFNLGMTYADDQKHDEAVRFLTRCIEVSQSEESHLRKAHALLVGALFQAHRLEEAWQACERGLLQFPEDQELLFRTGILNHARGRHEDAISAYERVLRSEPPGYFSSLDPGLRGYKSRQNLAAVYEDLGDRVKAETCWRSIVQEVPDYPPGWTGLGENLLQQGRASEVEELVGRLRNGPPALKAVAGFLSAQRHIRSGDRETAVQELVEADRCNPRSLDAWKSYCQLAFECGDPDVAQSALEELVRRSPDDASAHHNLGTVHLRRCDYARAAGAFNTSLGLRPRSSQTWLYLGYAYTGLAKPELARKAFQNALEFDPALREAAEALSKLA